MAAGRHLGKLQRHRAVSLRQHGFLVFSLLFHIVYVCVWVHLLFVITFMSNKPVGELARAAAKL